MQFAGSMHTPILLIFSFQMYAMAKQESGEDNCDIPNKRSTALPRTKVSPSGIFPSERHKPCGSFVLGIVAAETARACRHYCTIIRSMILHAQLVKDIGR